jgi:hypothetical protein
LVKVYSLFEISMSSFPISLLNMLPHGSDAPWHCPLLFSTYSSLPSVTIIIVHVSGCKI